MPFLATMEEKRAKSKRGFKMVKFNFEDCGRHTGGKVIFAVQKKKGLRNLSAPSGGESPES